VLLGRLCLVEYSFAEPDRFLSASRVMWGSPSPSIHFRHRRRANVVWCDGHVSAEPLCRSDSAASRNLQVGWFSATADNHYFAPF
jgi:prepilin-type processing-associated H-X9-DG protein